MNKRTRVLVLLIAASLAGTAIVATQFVRTSATMSMTVNTNLAFVQLMASDRSPTTAGAFVLRCAAVPCVAGSTYQLTIGVWAVGQDKVLTAAFALVNAEVAIDLTLISMVLSDVCPAVACPIDVFAHSDPGASCSGLTGVPSDTPPPGDCAQYVNDGGEAGLPVTAWVLRRGCGVYDTTGTDDLQYGDNNPVAASCTVDAPAGLCESQWDALNGVWTSDLAEATCTVATHENAVTGETNHVWIEIVLTGVASGAAWTPSLSLILSGGGGP